MTQRFLSINFTNNPILSCFFFFLLIIDLYFLSHALIGQFLNPIAELIIPVGIPSRKAKAEFEMHLVTVKVKI